MAEKINDFGRPIGASRPGSRDLGQLRGEGLTGAGSVLTLPALETDLHRYRGALRRQTLQMALVPSVSARRSLSAVWTDARPAGHPGNQPLTADPLRGQNSYALPEGPTRSSLHTVKLLLGPRPIKSATESEAEPSISKLSAKATRLSLICAQPGHKLDALQGGDYPAAPHKFQGSDRHGYGKALSVGFARRRRARRL